MTEIVKLQRPVSPPNGPWLAYAQGSQKMRMISADRLPTHVIEQMFGINKAFFEGTFDFENGWTFGRRVEMQDW
jgi:hypothetical protein